MAEGRTRSRRIAQRDEQKKMDADVVEGHQKAETASTRWSVKEKEQFLLGLKRFGSANIHRIQQTYVPQKRPEAIQSYLNGLKRLQNVTATGADYQLVRPRAREAPIECWIELAETKPLNQTVSYPQVLPTLVQAIGRYEDHPAMASEDDVDYAAIYESVGDLMKGEVPRDLNRATSLKMSQLMSRLLLYAQKNQADLSEAKEAIANFNIPWNFTEIQPFDPQELTNDFNFPAKLFTHRP